MVFAEDINLNREYHVTKLKCLTRKIMLFCISGWLLRDYSRYFLKVPIVVRNPGIMSVLLST
jgi:hypothetical protein